ncbi:biotin-dependent carboxyltransferase family protein [Salinispirillum sp. LH 10-3-1]|uniref:Biotin-dependent carboxyltransferase family protein n=1 Tax=Salinispirillum sp. LH 10-3-1 TaxID=2952525 RepID=A0AB38YGQ1_9GAMM
MSLLVQQAGALALLQDTGRVLGGKYGLTAGGAADLHAHHWANRLLGNPATAATVEVTIGLFSVTFTQPTTIAVTGADLGLRLNGQPHRHWCSLHVGPDDELSFQHPQQGAASGLRAYLAVSEGFMTPQRFGSRSVVVREGIGGINGAALQSSDVLPYRPMSRKVLHQVPPQFIPDYAAPLTLRVVAGYQYEQFSASAQHQLCSAPYRLTDQLDRMGYRLQGPAVSPPAQGLISEGIALGSVQIPPDGQPIILLQDRQTIGGYPKIGCVSALDCYRLSQRGPGAEVSFAWAHLPTIQTERREFERFFRMPFSPNN